MRTRRILWRSGCLVAIGFVLSSCAARPTGTGSVGLSPASAGEPTYRLSEFSITYPFPPDLTGSSPADTEHVGISYRADWVGRVFPGKAECEVMLKASNGETVGTWYFTLTSVEPRAHVGQSAVEVTGEPTAVIPVCARSVPPTETGATYRFSDTRVEPAEGPGDDARIVGTIETEGGDEPGTHRCTAKVILADGSTQPLNFNLTSGSGETLIVLLPKELETARSASITCEALR